MLCEFYRLTVYSNLDKLLEIEKFIHKHCLSWANVRYWKTIRPLNKQTNTGTRQERDIWLYQVKVFHSSINQQVPAKYVIHDRQLIYYTHRHHIYYM